MYNRGSKIAEIIALKIIETVSTQVGQMLFNKLLDNLSQAFSEWWNSNPNYASYVHNNVNPLISANPNKPLDYRPILGFPPTSLQQKQRQQNIIYHIVYTALSVWFSLNPQDKQQVLINSGCYQGTLYNYDQILVNFLTILVKRYYGR